MPQYDLYWGIFCPNFENSLGKTFFWWYTKMVGTNV